MLTREQRRAQLDVLSKTVEGRKRIVEAYHNAGYPTHPPLNAQEHLEQLITGILNAEYSEKQEPPG